MASMVLEKGKEVPVIPSGEGTIEVAWLASEYILRCECGGLTKPCQVPGGQLQCDLSGTCQQCRKTVSVTVNEVADQM